MNPVLFVDYDGVLHKFGEQALDEGFNLIANSALFCWVPHLERLLTPYPEIRIVVSSDWRRLFPDETLADLLGALKPRVIGAVEISCSPRSEEIRREAARRGLVHWLALDDHFSVLDAERVGDERYVGCAPETGLSDPLVQAKLARRLADLMARYRAP
ncbi:HAD domain-containing protein [Azoarcus sp. KH32C]|uniref:HAD domain-containing protein n=1 Tax=Azoarcus sp. KH32C TaxID=748247 RepID=UPI0002385FD0|nr:HAD domain-containing protein [Azoarcus sp. KH32C]BAL23499.1 hypothetical protein AZKH_1170 [Azoarcus sp. KH32C]